jgi:hypothetical protein
MCRQGPSCVKLDPGEDTAPGQTITIAGRWSVPRGTPAHPAHCGPGHLELERLGAKSPFQPRSANDVVSTALEHRTGTPAAQRRCDSGAWPSGRIAGRRHRNDTKSVA